jgi:putative heme iron utilization protein
LDEEGGAAAAFAARGLLRAAKWATLATQNAGQPFASLVTHAVAPDGAVLLLLSALAEHSRYLAVENRCALMVVGAPENLNWHTAPRLTVTGEAAVVTDRAARQFWLGRHPYARLYADFTDFSVWRLMPAQALFVGGFGQVARLSGASLAPAAASVASVAAVADEIVAQCNARHQEALTRLAHAAGAQGAWRLLGVDVDGVELAQDEAVMRVPFPAPVEDGAGARAALVRMVDLARHPHW